MSNDEQNHVSRHRFLHSLGLAGVAGASGSLLVACGEGSQAACTDLSALSAQQKEQRKKMVKSLQYVKESPKEGKYCSNCSQYVKSEFGDSCGGCTLFPGPVHPDGYCNSWVAAKGTSA